MAKVVVTFEVPSKSAAEDLRRRLKTCLIDDRKPWIPGIHLRGVTSIKIESEAEERR